MTIYKNKRMQVFQHLSTKQNSPRLKEFFKFYLDPTSKRREMFQRNARLRLNPLKPRTKGGYLMDFEKLRSLEDSNVELEKIQQYIDEIIEKNLKKMAEKRKEEQNKNTFKLPSLKETVTMRKSSIFLKRCYLD